MQKMSAQVTSTFWKNFAQQADIWEKTIATSNEAYTNRSHQISELSTTIQTKVDEQDPRELLTTFLTNQRLKKACQALGEQQRKDTQKLQGTIGYQQDRYEAKQTVWFAAVKTSRL